MKETTTKHPENRRAEPIWRLWPFILCLTLLMASHPNPSQAQDTYYYYQGHKTQLLIDSSRISLSRITPATSDALPQNVLFPKNIGRFSHTKYAADSVFSVELYEISGPYPPGLKQGMDEIKDYLKDISTQNDIIAQPCYKTPWGAKLCPTIYVSVKLKRASDFHNLISEANRLNLHYVGQESGFALWHVFHITPQSPGGVVEVSNLLYESGLCSAVEPDLAPEKVLCFSWDQYIDQQWGLYNSQFAGTDINISKAWNYATGWGVKIAIVDSGVDILHPDLRDNILNAGYDAEHNVAGNQVYDFHGTHCAGIAAAVRHNGIGIAGVAPDAEILPVSFDTRVLVPLDDPTGAITYKRKSSIVARGIKWAYRNGADVISCSWELPGNSEILTEAIDSALTWGRRGLGCVVAFASGNDTFSYVPCQAGTDTRILVVGNINPQGQRLASSNYGTALDVMGPGTDILSTIPNRSYLNLTGTSMACPHAAGLAALILERNPTLTNLQVNDIIERTCRKIGPLPYLQNAPNGSRNDEYGYGLIDAYNALINTPRP